MEARLLLAIFDVAFWIALSAWLGSVLFVSFGLAPLISGVLDAPSAARFVRALFPRYYMWGAYSAAICLAAIVCGRLTHNEYRGPVTGLLAVVAIAGVLVMLYAYNVLTPAINAARDAGPDASRRLERLHRRSVVLNGVSMALASVLLVFQVARPAPRTSGIVEISPRESASRDAEVLRKRTEEFERRLRANGIESPTVRSAPAGRR